MPFRLLFRALAGLVLTIIMAGVQSNLALAQREGGDGQRQGGGGARGGGPRGGGGGPLGRGGVDFPGRGQQVQGTASIRGVGASSDTDSPVRRQQVRATSAR